MSALSVGSFCSLSEAQLSHRQVTLSVLETGWSALVPVSRLLEVEARVRLAVVSCADRLGLGLQLGGDCGSPTEANQE